MQKEQSCGGLFAAILLAFFVSVPLGGTVAADLWRWFVVATWSNAPTLSWSTAAGLLLLCGIARGLRRVSQDDDALLHCIAWILTLLCAWGAGAALHRFF